MPLYSFKLSTPEEAGVHVGNRDPKRVAHEVFAKFPGVIIEEAWVANHKLLVKVDREVSDFSEHLVRRSIPAHDAGLMYFQCLLCIEELKRLKEQGGLLGITPKEFARQQVSFTKLGIQVWCTRHECNICHINFEGMKHPANLDRLAADTNLELRKGDALAACESLSRALTVAASTIEQIATDATVRDSAKLFRAIVAEGRALVGEPAGVAADDGKSLADAVLEANVLSGIMTKLN